MDVAAVAFMDSVRRLVVWWTAELKALVPGRFRQWFEESGRAGRLVLKNDGTVALRDERNGEATAETVYGSLDEAAGEGAPLLRRRPLRVVLSDADHFARDISIPRGARSRVRDVLGFELEQSTPFRFDEIYWGYRLQPGSRGRWIAARQFIAKRSRVHAIIEPLRRAGVVVQAVGIEDADASFVGLYALPERPAARAARLCLRSTLLGLLTASVVLAGATIALLFHRQTVALSQLEADLERMQVQAVAVQTKLEGLRAASRITDGLLRRKFETAALVTLLAESSRILPDTAWVTELQFEGRSASLTGEAKSAPELINLLEASPLFSQVAFAAPVTRAAASETESFTIRLAVEGAGSPGAAAAGKRP